MKNKPLTYAAAGVDIDKGDAFIDDVKRIVKNTPQTGVMGKIGGFGGLFSPEAAGFVNPILVSATDGVGTKLKIAIEMNKHNTIGIDLVAMCVNDIIVQGATPLFFLDYMAMGKLDTDIAKQILEGVAEGCRQANCALIGGETAEMPGVYKEGDYDLAGFSVGAIDKDNIIDGHTQIREGNKLLGLASNGVHSNGYSLARKIVFDVMGLSVTDYIDELGQTIGDALLTPTRIYTQQIATVLKSYPLSGIAHITGGGIPGNLARILPKGCRARLKKNSWTVLPIFTFLQKNGHVEDAEMLRTFNCGLGMILAVDSEFCTNVKEKFEEAGETVFEIGDIHGCTLDENPIEWVA